jgi:hypothetical protein
VIAPMDTLCCAAPGFRTRESSSRILRNGRSPVRPAVRRAAARADRGLPGTGGDVVSMRCPDPGVRDACPVPNPQGGGTLGPALPRSSGHHTGTWGTGRGRRRAARAPGIGNGAWVGARTDAASWRPPQVAGPHDLARQLEPVGRLVHLAVAYPLPGWSRSRSLTAARRSRLPMPTGPGANDRQHHGIDVPDPSMSTRSGRIRAVVTRSATRSDAHASLRTKKVGHPSPGARRPGIARRRESSRNVSERHRRPCVDVEIPSKCFSFDVTMPAISSMACVAMRTSPSRPCGNAPVPP